MRIEQLHYFHTLIQEGSFTKAAEQLHIAQPTLTASIKAMEKELNSKLLKRESTGIALTEEGHKVLRFTQAVLKLHNNLIEELNSSPLPNDETITVFATNFFYKVFLENFIPDFSAQTKILVRSADLDFVTSLESFFINNCNFAFVSRLTSDDDSKCVPDMLTPDDKFFFNDLTYIPIFQSKFGACMSSKSSLLYVEEFTPIYTHTVRQPMTLFPTRHLKMSDRILFITSTPEKHIQAITENNAICNMPYFAYRYFFGKEENIVFRPYDNNVLHTHYLVYPKNHTLTKAEQLFIDAFAKYLSQMKQS